MTKFTSTIDSNCKEFVQNRISLLMFLNRRGFTFLIFMFLMFLFVNHASAQEIKNIRVTQDGNHVNVLYDLAGKGQTFKVNLFYSVNDGTTWQGPLLRASGDVGDKVQPGNNKQILWDIQSESELKDGYLQFKLVADVSEVFVPQEQGTIDPNSNLKISKYKTGKTISLVTAIASAGTGVFALVQGNKLYDEYKLATDDAANLHSKIETYDIIYPVAFAVAGVSTVSFIIYAGKQNKAKKMLSFQPVPIKSGGGILLTYKF